MKSRVVVGSVIALLAAMWVMQAQAAPQTGPNRVCGTSSRRHVDGNAAWRRTRQTGNTISARGSMLLESIITASRVPRLFQLNLC